MKPSGVMSVPGRIWKRFGFSVATLAKMIEHSPSVPVISTDADGIIDFWNTGAEHIFGLPAKEVVGKSSFVALLPPASSDELHAAMRTEAFRHGEPIHLEMQAITFTSEPCWVRLSVSARMNSAGKVDGAVAIGEDITERKRGATKQAAIYAISAAVQSGQSPEELFRSIHQSISEILPAKNFYIALYDQKSDLISFPYFVDEFDPPPQPRKATRGLTEYVLRTSAPLLASPDRFRELVQSGEVESLGEPSLDWLGVPLRVADQTLGVLVVQTYSEGTRYSEDDMKMLSFVSSQIAMAIDRTQKELSLRTSEAELRSLFSAMNDVVLLLDSDGRYLKIAPTNPALLYRPSDQLIGKTIREVFPPDRADLFMGYIHDALASRAPVKGEYLLRISEQEIWFEATISPAGDDTVLLVARDNTARKRAEEALREAEENYKGIFEQAVMGIAKCTPDGRYISVNPALARIYGYASPEELLADAAGNGGELKTNSGRCGELMEMLRSSDKTSGLESQVTREDGTVVWVSENIQAVRDGEGRIAHCIITVEDVTARKQVEKELRLLANTITCAKDCFVLSDLEGKILFVNEALLATYGYNDQELLGKNVTILLPPDTGPSLIGEMYSTSAAGWNGELMHRRKDGTDFPVELWVSVVRSDSGEAVAHVGVARDITGRKRIEQAIRRSEERLRRITDNMLDMICQVDVRGVCQYGSPSIRKVLGFELNDVLGKPLGRFVHRKDLLRVVRLFRSLAENPRTGKIEYRCRNVSGAVIWIESIVNPLVDHDGTTVTGFVIGSVDVTDRKKAEETLRLDESRLETLLKLNQMIGASIHHITEFALEEAVRLTKSHSGYLAFVNADETVLTMHAWSKTAMAECHMEQRPLVFPVASTGLLGEPVRQRRPIIVNDYEQPSLLKRGSPDGHIAIKRHMGIPVFDGDRIVAVAGVANKEEEYSNSDVRQITLLMEGMWLLLQRQQSEEKIRKSLDEKEVLLKEIHHRVKNNLQIISSLLNLQTGQVKDPQLLEILRESQNRIRSMALIHERLYRSEDFSRVDFAQYVNGLTTYLVRSYAGDTRSFNLQVDVQDVSLGVDLAIPCGLIINELVSNCLKHAFTERERGEVTVGLRKEGGSYLLRVEDNGVGLPGDVDLKKVESLGLQLVETLSTQIGASVTVATVPGKGTAFNIAFPAH
jgi:PAS domain S-box-containing protein